MNAKFKNSIIIKEIESINDTHYIIRFDYDNYIKFYISPEKNCCENFGINFMYNKSSVFLKSLPLIGAKLNGIKICDKYHIGKHSDNSLQKEIILFTSIGLLFVNIYNDHNGYYYHDIEIDIYTPERKTTIYDRI